MDTADPANIATVKENVKRLNPKAILIEAASPITVDKPELIENKRVLVVEDGPTITHGNMPYGAGIIAAKQLGAKEIVDPRTHAVGSIVKTFEKYPHLGAVLPAVGYGKGQMKELEETINETPCDAVLIGTPIDLRQVLQLNKPAARAYYELEELSKPSLESILEQRFPRK